MRVRSYSLTHVGLRREKNEDAFKVDDDLGLYVVADGVGGNALGEVASSEGVEQVHGYVRNRGREAIEAYRSGATADEIAILRRVLESAVQHACYMVFGLGDLDPAARGMSTTLSALLVVPGAGRGAGIVGQVGDSRVYRIRDRQVAQLTEDHTLVNYKVKKGLMTAEEAARSPARNVITRAVGHRDYVQVDTCEVDVLAGDTFLLCSDGLHGYLEDREIVPLLEAGPIELAPHRFVAMANNRGGRDNITAVVVVAS